MNDDLRPSPSTSAWTRRDFLRTTALGLVVVGTAGGVAACGGTDSTGTATAPTGASGTPKKGGTLRVGASGGASTDTLDPQAWVTAPDQIRIQQLYDPLVWMDNDAKPQMVLAESIEPNADATVWTIKIKSGVVTHAGKPFIADDVLFSLQRIVDNKSPALSLLGPIDLKASKVVDATTVQVAFSKPFAVLMDSLSFPYLYMVPRGFDPKQPDGTGPFKYESFTPGTESTFVRNENYWQQGLPYLDKIVTINIADEASQVNGLQSGQVDMINALSAGSVSALKGAGFNVSISESGNWVPFTMHNGIAPFSDVRVRQAFRLIPDRKQMLQQVFGGNGAIGNDVFSPFDPAFPTDLPQREQDLDQAKSLLKAAGQEGMKIKLVTAPAGAGEVNMAQVFATQAKAAGVTVEVVQQTVTAFYSDSYMKIPFGMDYGTNQMFTCNAAQLMIGDISFFNANHFNDPEYTSLYDQALSTVDQAKRTDVIHQMATIDHDRGGYIVPVFSPVIEAYSSKVGGAKAPRSGVSPGNADFKRFWLA